MSGGVADAPVRNPLDVVLRAFAIARNQRFERELATAMVGREVQLVVDREASAPNMRPNTIVITVQSNTVRPQP